MLQATATKTGMLAQAGFDLAVTEASLNTTIFVSLLSTWVLVGLFQYLNRHTHRRYFSIWTAGWLFYALFLTISVSSGLAPSAMFLMWRNWSIATSAVLMLWGGFDFLKLAVRERLMYVALGFVAVWSYASAYMFPGEIWIQAPAFVLLATASGFNAYSFFFFRREKKYLGAGLLTFGFGLWAMYLAIYPVLQAPAHLLSMAFLISSVLQLFIAVSMIVLVLEEARRDLHATRANLAEQEMESAFLRTSVQESEVRFHQIFDNATDAVLIISENDLAILEANRAAKRLLKLPDGLEPEQFTRYLGGSAGENGAERLKALTQRGECTLVGGDGGRIQVEARGNSIPYAGGKAFQLLLVELTEKARLQQQLRQAEKLSALGQVISGVAHELNNPLAAIKGYTDLVLLGDNLEPSTRSALQKVAHESERAAKLVRSFLSFTRAEAPSFELFDLSKLARESVGVCEAELKKHGIEVAADLRDECVIRGVRYQIEQVLVNILANARDALATRPGERRIRVATRAQGEKVTLQIEDNGPGIPEEMVQKIFEPFFTTKPLGDGTGLGLSLCYRIVAAHDGQIRYQPGANGGACFVVVLPRQNAPSAAPTQEPASELEGAPGPLRILVVDDEPNLSSLLQSMLELSGHQVRSFERAQAALDVIEPGRFDVVISDFRMPQMNGGEFYARAMEKDHRLKDRFIFLTGDTVNEVTASFFQATPVRCLLKPFTLSGVNKAIAQLYRENEADSTSEVPGRPASNKVQAAV